jgi:WD40 repeat protein
MQLVNHVYFSPDGQWVASASFDKFVKLWNGITGKFVAAFRAMLDLFIRSGLICFNHFGTPILLFLQWFSL